MKKYIPEIDGLRALAVMAVVIFHVNKDILPGGFLGVDIFFVISGFLISSIISRDVIAGSWSYKRFYIKRIRRLAPAMLIVCAVTLALGFLLVSPAHFAHLGKSTISSVAYVSNIQFWQDAGYFNSNSIFKPLLHTWSLSVEEQFYLIWPVLIVLSLKISRSFLFVVFIFLFLVSLGGSIYYEAKDPVAVFYLMPFRIYEFSIGALLLFGMKKVTLRGLQADIARVLGSAFLILPMFLLNGHLPFMQIWALITCIGVCLVILAGSEGVSRHFYTNGVAVFLGKISYSLYLVHWPLITLYFAFSFKIFDIVEQIILVMLSIVLGYLLHRFIENPFRFGRESKESSPHSSPAKRTFAIVFGFWFAASLLLSAGGGYIWKENGIASRIDRAARILYASRLTKVKPCQNIDGAGDKVIGLRPACILGDETRDRYSVIMIGDSHAEAWTPGLNDYAKQRNIKAYVGGRNGNAPLQNIIPIVGNFRAAPIGDMYNQLIDWTLEEKPDVVILSARWPLYYYTKSPIDDGRVYRFISTEKIPRNQLRIAARAFGKV